MSKFIEKRKKIRILPCGNLFVIFSHCNNKLFPVIDFCEKGLSIACNESGCKAKKKVWLKTIRKRKMPRLDIVVPDVGFSIEKIPYQIVSDTDICVDNMNNHVRRRIRFLDLKEDQAYWLSYLFNTNVSESSEESGLASLPNEEICA